jgi:uncharacterized membrane protein
MTATETTAQTASAMAQRLYYLASSAYVALIVLSLAWEGWLAPARNVPAGFWLTLKTLPLLLPLFGLLRGRPYTHAWASMLVLPYFIEGVVLAYQFRAEACSLHATLPYALLETLLCSVFIVSATFYARLRALELRTPAA